jgi:hypothetical protein
MTEKYPFLYHLARFDTCLLSLHVQFVYDYTENDIFDAAWCAFKCSLCVAANISTSKYVYINLLEATCVRVIKFINCLCNSNFTIYKQFL